MKSRLTAIAFAAAAFGFAASAEAAIVTFNPKSNPAVLETEYQGVVAPGGVLLANYIDFGVDFTYGGNEGYFNDSLPGFDPYYAFGGAGFNLDTHDPYEFVDGRIVVQGTTDIGQTSFLSLFAGFAFTNTLTLQAWNFKGELVGTAQNDCGAGQCRSYITLNAPGISYFRLSSTGQDTYGIPEIQLETPTAAPANFVPEPSTWAIMIMGFGAMGAALRQRRRQLVRVRA